MRKTGLCLLSFLAVLCACDLTGSGGSGGSSSGSGAKLGGNLVATPPPERMTAANAPQIYQKGDQLKDAVGPANAEGAVGAGKVLFDGAGQPGGDEPGAVKAAPGNKAAPAFTGEGAKNTLKIVPPPAPGETATKADLSKIQLNEELGDAPERRKILERAQQFLGIPYKFGYDGLDGMDCSAYVSRAWGVPRHGTSSMMQVAYKINKDELEPGDALVLDIHKSETGYGHIRLFVGWADADKKEIWITEESGPGGSAYKKVKYSSAYQPIRRKDLARLAPNPEVVAVTVKPGMLLIGDSHSTGAFGKTLDARLRETYTDMQVETYAECGSSPLWFLPGNSVSGHKSGCGTFFHRYGGSNNEKLIEERTAKPTPIITSLIKPETEVVLIELGANLCDWKNGGGCSLDSVKDLAQRVHKSGARCLWIGPPEMHGTQTDAQAAATMTALKDGIKANIAGLCEYVESRAACGEGDSMRIHCGTAPGTAWGEQVFGDVRKVLSGEGGQGQ